MQKLMTVRVDENEYKLIEELTKIEKEEKSRVVREMLALGRLMFSIQKYQKGKFSLGKSAKISGISISEFMDVLSKFGIESRITYSDYLEGLQNLKKVW